MMQRIRKGMDGLREVVTLIWTDATPFVRARLIIALLLIMVALTGPKSAMLVTL